MAIDPLILFCIYLISFIPFIILGIAKHQTESYARRLATAKTDRSSGPLPFFVRLHGITVRTVKASLIANLGATAIFFGLPLLVIGILSPQDLPEILQSLRFWGPLLTFMVLLRVICTSPDSTGGLGIYGETRQHSDGD